MSWRQHVACGDSPHLFVHDLKGGRASYVLAEARALCNVCPVKAQCFEDSLKPMYVTEDNHGKRVPVYPEGIYAGLTREQRKPLIAARIKAEAARKRAAVAALAGSGMTVAQVAKATGTSNGRASVIMREVAA